MLPDTSTEQQALPPDDAVAFISLDGSTAAAPKAAFTESPSAQQPEGGDESFLQLPCEWQSDIGSPAVPFAELDLPCPTAPPADLQDSSSRGQSSTPADLQESSSRPHSSTPSWRSRVFNRPPEQQQQGAALPPGCLVLDGEALLWNDYEEPQQQQQHHAGFAQTYGSGLVGRAGSSDGVSAMQQQRMRSSVSTPNLVLLADGTQELQQEHQPQLQQQYHLLQQQQGREQLQPVMQSSPSYDSLLSLSQSGQLSSPASPALVSMSASGTAPKSRLGRSTGDTTPRQQQQQQSSDGVSPRQQQQQQQEGMQESLQHQLLQHRQQQQSFQFIPPGPLPAEQPNTFGSTWDRIQQQQQRLGGSPQPQPLRSNSGPGSGSAPRVTSWTFSRCNSGLSLGSDALGRKLRVHCLTFNMNSKLPASLPREMLGECGALAGADADGSPDLLVFATQENAYISEWEKLLSASLAPEGYERLAWHSLRQIHLVLFAGKRFRRQVLSIRGSSVATGIGNVVGNKGAVALSVELLDLKLLFISSHLAAHGDQVQRRNDDYQRIRAGLFASTTTTTTPTPRTTGTLDTPTKSPRGGRRGSLDVPRPLPMSAPAARAANSDGGAKASTDSFAGMSSRTGSIPWGGFLRSNRVMDSSAFEEANRSPANAGRKQVSWWAEQESGDSTPTCSSPLLAVNPSATSESLLCQHTRGSPLAADSNKLRVASCPFMEQQQSGSLVGGVSDSSCSSSCAASGAESPAWGGGGLTPVDRTGRTSSSFLRTLVGKQPGKSSGRAGDALESHDVVFWLGDLNYRINGNSKAVRHLMRSRLHEVLHANDQLRLQQKMGTVFQGFQEGQIRFPPTFKFLPGSSAYSEKRVPSWTDRILWKVRSRQQPPLLPQQQSPSLPQQPPLLPQQQQPSLPQQQQPSLPQQQQPLLPQQQQSLAAQQDEPQMSWVSGDGSIGNSSMFVPPSVSQLYYTSVPEIVISDHKPVISGFVIAAIGEDEEEEGAAMLGDDSSDEADDEGRNAKRSRCCMM